MRAQSVRMARQRGMSLVAALFIIVILAMLSLFAVRVSASGDQDVSMALMESRALAAARTGIEYGAYRAMVAASCTGVPVNVNLTQAALAGFTLTVTCLGSNHLNAGVQYWTYEITSIARRGTYGTADYVSRTLTQTVANGAP